VITASRSAAHAVLLGDPDHLVCDSDRVAVGQDAFTGLSEISVDVGPVLAPEIADAQRAIVYGKDAVGFATR
jgi:hypothetical protein